jgi:hypothetical protein
LATLRCDVLVLGSSLGALAAGTALARTGMRVVLVEEEVHAKRPALLREPFLLTGLEPGGPVDGLLRELAIPLLERRELAFDPLVAQVVLPEGARLDVGGSRKALAAELWAFGIGDAAEIEAWFEASDAVGDAVRERLRDVPAPATRALPGRLPGLRRDPVLDAAPPPEPPGALEPLLDALEWALSGLAIPVRAPARSLLLRGTRDGVARSLHAGRGLLDLFRRRFTSLHGEVRAAGAFGIRTEGREVGVELARDRIFARALLLGAPREPLARAAEEGGSVPRWLAAAPPPQRIERRVLRAEAHALPIGMGSRVIVARESGGPGPFSLARFPDPGDKATEWVVVSGPAAATATEAGLGGLAPFSEGRIVAIDPGPSPRWDIDGVELHFPEARVPEVLKRSPLVLCVGPERAPELGFEGELLLARRTAHTALAALGR